MAMLDYAAGVAVDVREESEEFLRKRERL